MSDEHSTPRRRRIVLCMGAYCNLGGQAEPLYEALRAAFGEPGPAFMARGPVSWEIANCLDMCGAGPNLVLYPEGEDYHALDPASLQRLIDRLRDEVRNQP